MRLHASAKEKIRAFSEGCLCCSENERGNNVDGEEAQVPE